VTANEPVGERPQEAIRGHQSAREAPRFALTGWCFVGLLALAMVGVGVTDFSSRDGLWYWLAVAPLFGVLSTAMGWSRARAAGQNRSSIVMRQLLHWASLAPILAVIYAFEHTGRLNREDAGLVSLLALALTTLLAGVHFDWRLVGLGLVLGLTSIAAALVEEFFWMLLIPVLLAAGIFYLWRRRSSGKSAPVTPRQTTP
jgi:hypothetical protein